MIIIMFYSLFPDNPFFFSHSAKPNESLKLMLVGLQKMGKTTLLSRLREVNESTTAASTFNERVKGEEKERGGGRGKKKGGEIIYVN